MSRYILIRRLRGPAILLLIGTLALLHQTGRDPALLAAVLAAAADHPGRVAAGRAGGAGRGRLSALSRRAVAEHAAIRRPNSGAGQPARRNSARKRGHGDCARRSSATTVRERQRGRAIMSSMPPNMPPNTPPGGGAPPPYDPKTQWRCLSRTAKSRVARATRCMARTAPRMEGELRGHVRPARAVDGRPDHPGVHRRDCAAGRQRPSRFRHVLDVVRPLVAAAADRRGAGAAGRVGAGHAPQNSGAAQRRLHRDSDLSRVSWARLQRRTTISGARSTATSAMAISSTPSECRSTTAISR